MRAIAVQSLRLLPPLRCLALRCKNYFRNKKSSPKLILPLISLTILKCSSTVNSSHSILLCATILMNDIDYYRYVSTDLPPSYVMRPSDLAIIIASTLNKLDLPAPLGPTNENMFDFGIAKVMSFRTYL